MVEHTSNLIPLEIAHNWQCSQTSAALPCKCSLACGKWHTDEELVMSLYFSICTNTIMYYRLVLVGVIPKPSASCLKILDNKGRWWTLTAESSYHAEWVALSDQLAFPARQLLSPITVTASSEISKPIPLLHCMRWRLLHLVAMLLWCSKWCGCTWCISQVFDAAFTKGRRAYSRALWTRECSFLIKISINGTSMNLSNNMPKQQLL